MQKLTLMSIILFGLLFVTGCEKNANPMSSNTNEVSNTELNILAKKGGNGGGGAATTTSTSGETAYACNVDGTFAGYNETNDPDYGVYSYTLWAGKHNDAGTVTITNDDDYIYVTYNTNETADLKEVHVYVWEDLADIPTKRPAPGHADYVVEDIFSDAVTVTIPLSDIEDACGDTYYISTHAALVGNATDNDEAGSGDNAGETGYAGDSSSPDCFDATKGAWWGFVNFTVSCYYDLSGTAYEDSNNSGDMESGEDTFGGLTVTVTDENNTVVATATTAADGSYLVEHLAGGGDYTVTITDPSGDYLANENAGGFAVTDLSDDQTDVDFGFVPLYDVSGTVYVDGNNSGDLENGEAQLGGLTVTATDENGTVYTTTTNSDGSYTLENLPAAGDYTIVVTDPAGDYLANENAGGTTLNDLSGDTTDVDFGYVPLFDLYASFDVYGDLDCYSNTIITINGSEVSSLENQLPLTEYTVVATAYDNDGAVLVSEEVTITLVEDTSISLELGGWTCPVPPVEDCNECLDGELVSNGSFEDGMTGWVHSGVSGYGGNSIDLGNWAGAASDGSWVIDLVGTGTPAQGMQPGSVQQILCTEAGEDYVLTFDVKTNGSASLLVTIDGNSQTFSSNGSYTSYTVAFTASSSTTTIRLAADASWHYWYNNVFLDNVSIACGTGVVDPSTGVVDPPTGDDDFPTWGQDISHIILVFTADSNPNGGSSDNDGYYTIKIDEYNNSASNDIDDEINVFLTALVNKGLLIDGKYELLGSSIKGGLQITSFYSYGSYNSNGSSSDTPPSGIGITYNGTKDNEGNQPSIDVTINLNSL